MNGDETNGTLISVGLWVINFYGFDFPSGSYVFDYYIYFFWTDPDTTTVNWSMMNGFPQRRA